MRIVTGWLLPCLLPLVAVAAEPYTYVHHPVSTDRPAAQEAFDRGLTLLLGYASDEAESSFRLAARLDPTLAMAWWGIALALGPDINTQPTAEKTHRAAEGLAHAAELALSRATPVEREYIAALTQRYSSAEKPDFDQLALGYRDAMRDLVARHPEDADAAALYAEALMDLHAWRLWSNTGEPAPGTLELVQVLESHLARSPDHIGLLHFYIHAVEASPHPERALAAAHRLGSLPMEPAAAHLVHMPAHIYLRVGDWADAIESNEHSAHHALDYRHSGRPTEPLACGHCLAFLQYAYQMAGNLAGARKSAEDFQRLSHDSSRLLATLARFSLWDEILTAPEPAAGDAGAQGEAHYQRGVWHYSRGLALAATGRGGRAEEELTALKAEFEQLPTPTALAPGVLDVEHALDELDRLGHREALALAEQVLQARLAQARGDGAGAIQHWRNAVSLQDQISYSEPPVWYYPVRESLGAALLRAGAAAQAQRVFEEDLQRTPDNPRSYFGLAAALRVQHRKAEAQAATVRFTELWRLADQRLALDDL